MAQYRTVEGELSATANTAANLTTFGAETGVGPVKVPANASRLVELWIAAAVDVDTAGDSAAIIMRLSGKGMREGYQDFAVAAGGSGVTSTGTPNAPARIYPVQLAVVPNETINVAAQYTGDTVGVQTMAVTLVFA